MAFGLAGHGRTVHGEHNDWGLGQEVFDGCSRLEPIHLRHGKVQDYQIGFELCSSGDGLAARHGVTANFPIGMGFEHAADAAQHGLVIVGNEDAFQRPRTCFQTIRADCRAPYRIMPRGGLAHFGAIYSPAQRLRLRCGIVPAWSSLAARAKNRASLARCRRRSCTGEGLPTTPNPARGTECCLGAAGDGETRRSNSAGQERPGSIQSLNSRFVNMSKPSGAHAFWGIPCANSDYFFVCSC